MRQAWRGVIVLAMIALAAPAVAQTKKPAATSPLAIPAAPADPNADIAFGAFQRGFYMTAFNEAAKRAQQRTTDAFRRRAPSCKLSGQVCNQTELQP